MTLQAQLHHILRHNFGFEQFRKGQEEAITALLTKGRVLCILPTGHGKSLLYQLPSCLLGGLTLVISPLLALMRDQIEHLQKRFNITAGAINSDQTPEENDIARQAAEQGMCQVLFVAPEQLDHVDRFASLLQLDIRLIVVDEAHCISTWGHDFRPSYRQILHFVHAVHHHNPQIKILGLTATANERVEEDIKKQLTLCNQEVVVLRDTLNRPNIKLSVIKARGVEAKLAACEELVKRMNGCGLIYCATRENTSLVADFLKIRGLSAEAYHAGMRSEDKLQLQRDFIADKYKALCATNALGMGIDKGNLRYIIHFDFPGSITAYYQEVGRCGRDGLPAEGIILYDFADKRIQEYFIQSALPSIDDFQNIMSVVQNSPEPLNLTGIKRVTGLHPTRVTIVIAELVDQGFLQKYSLKGSQVYKCIIKQQKPDLSRYENQQLVKNEELKQMVHYSLQTNDCRMGILRHYLGDKTVQECKQCDACHQDFKLALYPDDYIAAISKWFTNRPLPIAAMAQQKVSEGLSILDGKMRAPLFVKFMMERANCPEGTLGMHDELIELLKNHLKNLTKSRKVVGIVPILSRTWHAREKIAFLLADHLQVPVFHNLLFWSSIPPKRQGELLNNDQRNHNIQNRMRVNTTLQIPMGTLILLDDYIGSGNTIKEAARAIREPKIFHQELVPFTVAAIKWHLGKPGYA